MFKADIVNIGSRGQTARYGISRLQFRPADDVSRPKLNLAESQDGLIHHLTVQSFEFDITTNCNIVKMEDK